MDFGDKSSGFADLKNTVDRGSAESLDRLIVAQSVQFSKIAKKLNIDLCQFFFSPKGSTVLIKIMK